MSPEIRYCTTDGDSIAYTHSGEGLPPVTASNILASHLGYTGGVYDKVASVGGAVRHHPVVRYDSRGTGLSSRESLNFPLDARLADFGAVVDHLCLERFALFAVIHGTATAVNYTVVAGILRRASRAACPSSSAQGATPPATPGGDQGLTQGWPLHDGER
jgi:pimeloyl-ACP methyl ester carboxylesterase